MTDEPAQNPETPDEQSIEALRWPEDEPFACPMEGESTAWLSRLASYCMQGPARSVRGVYNAERGNTESKSVPGPWHKASQRFQWRRRAAEYDAWRRSALFTIGNASDTVRVKKLHELAEAMHERIMERMASMEINDRFVGQYLAVMDLLAKHTGGYGPQRIEHTGRDGGKIEVEETKLNVVWYMPEVAPLDDSGQGNSAEVEDVQGDNEAGPVLDDADAGDRA